MRQASLQKEHEFGKLQDALVSKLRADHEAERNRAVEEVRQDLEDRHDREMTQLEDKLRAELNDTLSQLKVEHICGY